MQTLEGKSVLRLSGIVARKIVKKYVQAREEIIKLDGCGKDPWQLNLLRCAGIVLRHGHFQVGEEAERITL